MDRWAATNGQIQFHELLRREESPYPREKLTDWDDLPESGAANRGHELLPARELTGPAADLGDVLRLAAHLAARHQQPPSRSR
ncbi:hypothetical protein [Streptomyces sp. NPDC093707]|uniref:hypothetical protein n=1 Tax=Streptomyces sp. NPDC093707 TaxID=3154984 RepID=UPI0034510D1E